MSSQSQKNPTRISNLSMGPHSKLHPKGNNTSIDVSSSQDGSSSTVEKPAAVQTAPSSNKKSNNQQQTNNGSKTLTDKKKENGHENDSTIKSTNGTHSENKNVSIAAAAGSGADAKKVVVVVAVDINKSGTGKNEEKTTGIANTAAVAAIATPTTTQSENQKNVKNKDIVGSEADMETTTNTTTSGSNTAAANTSTSPSEVPQEKPNKLSSSLRESPRQKELKDREINEKDKQNGERNVANTSSASAVNIGNTGGAVRESPRQREMKERDSEKDKITAVSAGVVGGGAAAAAPLQRDSPKAKGQNNQNDDEKLMSQTKTTTPTSDKKEKKSENDEMESSTSPSKPKGKVLKYTKDDWTITAESTAATNTSKCNVEKSTYTPASQTLSTSKSTSTMTTTQTRTSLPSSVQRTSTPNKYTSNYNSSLRTISGRRSVRPMGELSLQYPTVRNESYRKIPNDFYDSYSSINATFGSDTRNTSATSTRTSTHSGKALKRSFPTNDDYDDNNLVDDDDDDDDGANVDDYDDIELKDLTPKKPRMEYITNFLGFVASPVTLLRAKFQRTNMHSTPNCSVNMSTSDDCPIQNEPHQFIDISLKSDEEQHQQQSAQAKSSGISMEATTGNEEKLNDSDEKITGLKMELSSNSSNDGISVDIENGTDDKSTQQKNVSSVIEATEDIEMEKLNMLKETTENVDIIEQQQQQQQEIETAKKVGRCMIM